MTLSIDPALATAAANWPTIDLSDVVAARVTESQLRGKRPVPDISGVEWATVAADAAGREPVDVRVYRPVEHDAPTPGILDIHGGGFILGSVENSHAHNVRACRELGVVVVSVEYRLAPEHPYPAPLEDCYTALVWVAEHANDLRIDPARIVLTGVSAGGGLAAGLALLARDRRGPEIAFQYLGIPELDDRMTSPSMTQFDASPAWNSTKARMSWDYYLGHGVAGGDSVDVYAAPSRATDLAGLPPAYVSAMQFDPLRDEAIEYASRLLQAGIPTELHVFAGTFHGSSTVDSAVSRYDNGERVEVLRRALF